MRKSQIIIDGLKRRLAEVERQRDEARDALNAGVARLHDKVDGLVKDHAAGAKAHTAALAKHGDDISNLADVVRGAVKTQATPEPEAEAASPVTPIKARTTKAAG